MIKPFPKNYIATSDIRIESDGDNSYHISSSMVNEFNRDVDYLQNKCKEFSDEHYKACDDFDSKWGPYQI